MSDEFHQHILKLSDRVDSAQRDMHAAIQEADAKFGTNNPANSLEAIGGHIGAITRMAGEVADAVRDEFGPGLGEHLQDQVAPIGQPAEFAAAVTGEIGEGSVEAFLELGMGVGMVGIDFAGAAGEIIENSGEALNHFGASNESPMEGVGEATGAWLNGVIEPVVGLAENLAVDTFGTAANVYGELLEANLEVGYQFVEPIVDLAVASLSADSTDNTSAPSSEASAADHSASDVDAGASGDASYGAGG